MTRPVMNPEILVTSFEVFSHVQNYQFLVTKSDCTSPFPQNEFWSKDLVRIQSSLKRYPTASLQEVSAALLLAACTRTRFSHRGRIAEEWRQPTMGAFARRRKCELPLSALAPPSNLLSPHWLRPQHRPS